MEEEIQLKLAEVMMDYYIDGNRQSLQDYIIEQCNKSEDGIFSVGDGMFSTVDGELSYTDSKGNTSVISVSNSGEVTIEGSVSAGGTVNDDKAPSISATSTTNSITFVAKDILAGVAGWNYSTTNSEPTTWNTVSPVQKSFTHTIENLANNTTYYVWAKDANGNVSTAKEIKTKDFGEFDYEVSWNGANATITVKSPSTGVQYLDESKNWVAYQGPLTVEAGTVVFFRVSDGYNNVEFESVKPVLNYTVSYNANGGTGTMASSQHEYGTAKNLTANGFSKTGYTFAGWATSESGAKVYDNEQSVINLASSNGATVTLYAIWTANMYSVTPHGNGMSVSLTGLKTRYGATVNVSSFGTLNRSGYDFMGWALTSDATEGITSFEMPAQDVILYAVWQPWPTATSAMSATNYGDVVTYRANGVNDWKVFLNDGTNVYLISSDYVPNSGVTSALDKKGSYVVYGKNYNFVSILANTSEWSAYASGFNGATATGGPTSQQFWASYNGKYGTSFSIETLDLNSHIGHNNTLYFPHTSEWNETKGYWLASPYPNNTDLGSADYRYWAGRNLVTYYYSEKTLGVRPLVRLPSSTKVKWNGSSWDLAN